MTSGAIQIDQQNVRRMSNKSSNSLLKTLLVDPIAPLSCLGTSQGSTQDVKPMSKSLNGKTYPCEDAILNEAISGWMRKRIFYRFAEMIHKVDLIVDSTMYGFLHENDRFQQRILADSQK